MPTHCDIVGEGIMFWGCPSNTFVYSFVHLFGFLDRYCYHNFSWTVRVIWMELTVNIH